MRFRLRHAPAVWIVYHFEVVLSREYVILKEASNIFYNYPKYLDKEVLMQCRAALEKSAFVRPGRLAPGDCIGIAAPASPFDRQRFDRGVHMLQEMGFQTIADDGVLKHPVIWPDRMSIGRKSSTAALPKTHQGGFLRARGVQAPLEDLYFFRLPVHKRMRKS